MSLEATYLRAILALIARKVFTPEELRKLVAPKAPGTKQVRAYNLLDGTRTQSEVAKETSFDPGNLSKTIQRWVSAGIMIPGERPAHLYPLSEDENG